ncbi:RPAP1-like protein [Emericellopsis atlantica]|uniref:RPAP1-like protein n=1 Tax=Emericellopsis atlantica TaxID=2614577 RepID=A0A9P8CKQ6_9HYPO|nr:RPAP1-like protein [Emericellopsis atlantica]KAG9250603.1 RPAP1-like protein [Emericellopsis atlantica]
MDPSALIGDIVERDASTKPANDFAEEAVSSTGFPQHKRRWKKASAFKQRRGAGNDEEQTSQTRPAPSQATPQSTEANVKMTYDEIEKQRIDEENRQKLNDMSPEEIAEAQRELLSGMNPSLVQRLLQRATIDVSSSTPYAAKPDAEKAAGPTAAAQAEVTSKPKVRFAEASVADEDVGAQEQDDFPTGRFNVNLSDDYDEDAEPTQRPDLDAMEDLPHKTHFPAPPPTDLDPNDPNFLESLHKKYFPSLPNDPSKLAWMAPVPTPDSTADQESPYYPHEEIPVSALRFDFKGRFLSPRVSRAIPSSKGLHHHGEAPEAAGYTVAELAHLGRSAVPAQRCIAYQTLGRILFRLGKGEWGTTENHPIAMGVWNAMKKGRVLDTLNEAASIEGGHRGSQAFATEALWLFEKGGWKEKVKGR